MSSPPLIGRQSPPLSLHDVFNWLRVPVLSGAQTQMTTVSSFLLVSHTQTQWSQVSQATAETTRPSNATQQMQMVASNAGTTTVSVAARPVLTSLLLLVYTPSAAR